MKTSNNIISKYLLNYFSESFPKFKVGNTEIELSFAIKKEGNISIILVFNDYLITYEDDLYEEFIQYIAEGYKKEFKEKSDITEDTDINFRFFSKNSFLAALNKYDPDVISIISDEIQIISGTEKIQELYKSIDNENLVTSKSILEYYFADSTSSFLKVQEKIIALDIQITRSFLNYLKLYYILNNRSKKKHNFFDLGSLSSIEKIKKIIKNIQFYGNTNEIYSTFIENKETSIQKKYELLEDFQVAFNKWVAEIFQQEIDETDCDIIVEWLKSIAIIIPHEIKEELREAIYPLIKAIEIKYEHKKEELKQIYRIIDSND
jgi:hypothetical protein